jgi:hypothetical protein
MSLPRRDSKMELAVERRRSDTGVVFLRGRSAVASIGGEIVPLGVGGSETAVQH